MAYMDNEGDSNVDGSDADADLDVDVGVSRMLKAEGDDGLHPQHD